MSKFKIPMDVAMALVSVREEIIAAHGEEVYNNALMGKLPNRTITQLTKFPEKPLEDPDK